MIFGAPSSEPLLDTLFGNSVSFRCLEVARGSILLYDWIVGTGGVRMGKWTPPRWLRRLGKVVDEWLTDLAGSIAPKSMEPVPVPVPVRARRPGNEPPSNERS